LFRNDIAIDYAFYHAGLPYNYSIPEESSHDGIRLLKLHGSLNWGKCTVCGMVIPWNLQSFFSQIQLQLLSRPKTVRLSIRKHFDRHVHCGKPVEADPLIVPPTWNKTQYHQEIADVWKAAAEELSTAEDVIVCGYSLPPTDVFFQHLFAIGTTGKTWLRRLWVFNPDTDNTVYPRFEKLVGAAARDRFLFQKVTFERSIDYLNDEMLQHI
jgi:hypothetical protein